MPSCRDALGCRAAASARASRGHHSSRNHVLERIGVRRAHDVARRRGRRRSRRRTRARDAARRRAARRSRPRARRRRGCRWRRRRHPRSSGRCRRAPARHRAGRGGSASPAESTSAPAQPAHRRRGRRRGRPRTRRIDAQARPVASAAPAARSARQSTATSGSAVRTRTPAGVCSSRTTRASHSPRAREARPVDSARDVHRRRREYRGDGCRRPGRMPRQHRVSVATPAPVRATVADDAVEPRDRGDEPRRRRREHLPHRPACVTRPSSTHDEPIARARPRRPRRGSRRPPSCASPRAARAASRGCRRRSRCRGRSAARRAAAPRASSRAPARCATRCCCPPDSCAGRRSPMPVEPDARQPLVGLAPPPTALRGRRARAARTRRSPCALRCGNSRGSWPSSTTPRARRASTCDARRRARRPASARPAARAPRRARTSPASAPSSVDLPAPLGPMTATTSPGARARTDGVAARNPAPLDDDARVERARRSSRRLRRARRARAAAPRSRSRAAAATARPRCPARRPAPLKAV